MFDKKSEGGKKSFKKLLVCIPVLVVVAVAVAAVVLMGGFGGSVTFQDPLVERCVRLTLEKEADEPITKKECASIEKLLIDCDLDVSCADWPEAVNYIDLCDLQYLTGLKELIIDNDVARDTLGNMDAIANCRKLEELTIHYNPVVTPYVGINPMGYKYMAGIVEELPKLEYLDLGYTVPEEYQELLAGDKKDLTFAEKEAVSVIQEVNDFSGTRMYTRDMEEYEKAWSYDEQDNMGTAMMEVADIGELEAFLEELSEDAEDICIYYTGDEAIDMELFADFAHLKTLTVFCDWFLVGAKEDQAVEINNLDALADNKELFSLNLCWAKGDFEEIGELSQLKELSLYGCVFEEPDFLGDLSELRELTILYNDCEDLEDYINDSGEQLSNLRFLRVWYDEFSDYKGIEEYPNLEVLSTYSNGYPSTLKYIAKCPRLKALTLVAMEEEVDISDLEELKTLEYLNVTRTNTSVKEIEGVEEVLKLPNLVSILLPSRSYLGDDYEDEVNDLIDIAADHPKLSLVVLNPYLYSWLDGDLMLQLELEGMDFEKLYDEGIMCSMHDLKLLENSDLYSTIDELME